MRLDPSSPIGIFDSGVGGISVLRVIREQMPEESILYFGDQGHVPYGSRSLLQIQGFSEAITSFLLERGAKALSQLPKRLAVCDRPGLSHAIEII